MLDREKAVEQLEVTCWHGEEIDGSDHLTMILKEREPAALGRVAAAANASQIPCDGPFCDNEPNFSNSPSIFGTPQPCLAPSVELERESPLCRQCENASH